MYMETKQIRLSPFVVSEIRKYGKEVEAQTDDVALRHILSDYRRLRELEEERKKKESEENDS
jgi:hypothetical protein